MAAEVKEIYHYTCSCWAPKIRAQQMLRASVHAILQYHGRMSWLTDLDDPMPRAIGLPVKPCDRLQFRVAVDAGLPQIVRWSPWSRRNVDLKLRQAVEANDPGALHAHWWLALGDVPILRVDDMRTPLKPKEPTDG